MSDEYNGLFFDGIIDTKCVYVASRLGCESFVLLQYFISSDLNALDIDAAIYNRTEQGHLCARPPSPLCRCFYTLDSLTALNQWLNVSNG